MAPISRPTLSLAVLTLVAGCAGAPQRQRVASFTAPDLATRMPARILVAPFDAPLCSSDTRSLITAAFAHEMQSALLSQIILAPEEDHRLTAEGACARRGRVNLETLIAAQKQYAADAFLFGSVTQYKAYDPAVIGLDVRLLSAEDGDVLWAAEAVFDARDRDVRRRVEEHFRSSGLSERLGGAELVFMSPQLFSRFVAAEILRPLSKTLPPEQPALMAGVESMLRRVP